jgi:hypothetical protein
LSNIGAPGPFRGAAAGWSAYGKTVHLWSEYPLKMRFSEIADFCRRSGKQGLFSEKRVKKPAMFPKNGVVFSKTGEKMRYFPEKCDFRKTTDR